MNLVKRFCLVALLGLFFSQTTYAESEEQYNLGRLRFGVKGSIAKDFLVASGEQVKKDVVRTAEIGPGANFEYLVLDWLALGGQYQALFEIGSKVIYQDFNAYTKFIFPSFSKNDNSELYFTVPAGFSLMMDGDKIFATGRGFNLGALFGGNYFFNNYFGLMAEAGYVYRRINTQVLKTEATLNFHALAINFGIIVKI